MSDQFRTEQPVIPWWKERIAALEAELAEADFNFGEWRSIKSRLQAENATLTAQLAEAKRKPKVKVNEAFVKQVEEEVGSSGGWDCINPIEICEAALKVSRANEAEDRLRDGALPQPENKSGNAVSTGACRAGEHDGYYLARISDGEINALIHGHMFPGGLLTPAERFEADRRIAYLKGLISAPPAERKAEDAE